MAKSVTKGDRAGSAAQAAKRGARQKQPSKRADKSRRGTKQSRAIALLRSRKGATLDALMKITGWQQHSVRGFLAGVVRKRLKLDLVSEVVEGRRVYRTRSDGPQNASADRSDQRLA